MPLDTSLGPGAVRWKEGEGGREKGREGEAGGGKRIGHPSVLIKLADALVGFGRDQRCLLVLL
jgi:hypothetical protein